MKVLSIPNLAQRLNERFKILTGGSRTALPRQKTLGALIDWSYDLLTPQEQMLFNRVGIFAGGFSLDAATAVCSGEDLDEIDILDLLSSLTDKSLVVADTAGEQERYHLLESTRAYALEKLTAAGAHERAGSPSRRVFSRSGAGGRRTLWHRLDGGLAGERGTGTGQLSRRVGVGAQRRTRYGAGWCRGWSAGKRFGLMADSRWRGAIGSALRKRVLTNRCTRRWRPGCGVRSAAFLR